MRYGAICLFCRQTFLALVAGGVFVATASSQQPQPDSQLPNPRINTVMPMGARAGTSVDVTISGTDIDEPEGLLFDVPGLVAEPIVLMGPPAPPPEGRGGGRRGGRNNPAGAVTTIRYRITVAPNTPLGNHDLRVIGRWGVSNPRTFVVGDLAETTEKEPNDDLAQAQRVELNTTINGAIGSPTDVDYFVFSGKKGQRVVVSCQCSSIDSTLEADLEVYDSRSRLLDSNRFYRHGDAVCDVELAADGDYYVRLCRFTYVTGGPDHFYRLSITTTPWIDAIFPSVLVPGKSTQVTIYGRNLPGGMPDPMALEGRRVLEKLTVPVPALADQAARERLQYSGRIDTTAAHLTGFEYRLRNEAGSSNPFFLTYARAPVVLDGGANKTAETAQPIPLPCEIAGHIEKKRDRDWYSFEAKKGEAYRLELLSNRLGAPTDIKFVLYNATKQQIFESQDNNDQIHPKIFTRSPDPVSYRFSVPSDGKYLVLVKSLTSEVLAGPRQFYQLRITADMPDFQLVVMPPADHLPDACRLPRGGSQCFTVFALRADDWKGDILVKVDGLPAKMSCPPQTMAGGLRQMPLVVTAAPDAEPWTGTVKVTGEATIDGRKVVHEARYASIAWAVPPLQNIPALTRLDRNLVLAVREEAPFVVSASLDKPVLKQGEKGTVTLKVRREAGVQLGWFPPPVPKFPVVIQPMDLPAPLIGVNNNQPLTIAQDKHDGTLAIEVKANTPPGAYNLVLRSQAQVPFNKDPTAQQKPPINVSLPVQPIAITVLPKSVASINASVANPAVKQGTQAEINVKVTRQFDYVGELKVQLVLPANVAGLSSTDLVIPAGQNEGKLLVKIAADAAPGPRADLIIRATGVLSNVPISSEAKITLNVTK